MTSCNSPICYSLLKPCATLESPVDVHYLHGVNVGIFHEFFCYFEFLYVFLVKMSLTTMSDTKVIFEEESQADRLARKSKETPFFPIAIGICTMAVGYGAYMFKRRGQMSPSVYLMHLRVGAQGAAVASLTVGLIYTMINEHVLKKGKKRRSE